MTTITTQSILLLASAHWHRPDKRLLAELELQALRLSNHLLSQQQQGRVVAVRWYINHAEIAQQLTIQLQKASCPEWVEFIVITNVDTAKQQSSAVEPMITEEIGCPPDQEGGWLDVWQQLLAIQIEHDINQHHRAALELWPPEQLDGLPIWFYGLLPNTDVLQQTEIENIWQHYAELLPKHHQAKAQTWLALLLQEYGTQELESWLIYNAFLTTAVALARYLHEFNELCDHGFSDICYSDAALLKINPLYLGNKLTEDEIVELEEYSHWEDQEIAVKGLELYIEREYRHLVEIPPAFSGHNDFFYTLWSSTWPDYESPARDRIMNLLNSDPTAEKQRAYGFVSCD